MKTITLAAFLFGWIIGGYIIQYRNSKKMEIDIPPNGTAVFHMRGTLRVEGGSGGTPGHPGHKGGIADNSHGSRIEISGDDPRRDKFEKIIMEGYGEYGNSKNKNGE